MLVATPDEGYAGCCAAIEHMDLVPELGAIRAPTLVIAGRQDPATPPEHGERIAAGIPGARLELVDAAHLATIEQPDVMTDLIAGHLLYARPGLRVGVTSRAGSICVAVAAGDGLASTVERR